MIRASKGLVKLNIIISMYNFPMKFIVKAVLDRQNDLKNKKEFPAKEKQRLAMFYSSMFDQSSRVEGRL